MKQFDDDEHPAQDRFAEDENEYDSEERQECEDYTKFYLFKLRNFWRKKSYSGIQFSNDHQSKIHL